MTYKISYEPLTPEFTPELDKILAENHKISGQFDELNMDWDQYLEMSENIFIFTLREEDEMVGLLIILVGAYPHNKGQMFADQLTFYVRRSHRKRAGELLLHAELYAKSLGAEFILQSARYGSSFCNTLTERGYTPLDVKYVKRLV